MATWVNTMKKRVYFLGLLACGLVALLAFVIPRFNPFGEDHPLIDDQPGLLRYQRPKDIIGVSRPAWSNYPDKVIYVGTQHGNDFGVYQLNLTSKENKRLFPQEEIVFYAFDQNRSQWAFLSHNIDTGVEGFFGYQNSEREPIEDYVCDGEPESWSPTSQELITIGSCGNPKRPCMCLVNLSSGKSSVLVEARNRDESIIEASWSPDGKIIALIYGTPPYSLYEFNVENGTLMELIKEPVISIANPRWDKTGDWIVYILRDGNNKSYLGIIRSDGKCNRKLFSGISGIKRFDLMDSDTKSAFLLLDQNDYFYALETTEMSKAMDLCQ